MPTYLCHGFRWHRASIRVYVVVQDIEDAAPDWIIGPGSSAAFLRSFYTAFDFLPEPKPNDEERQPNKLTSRKRTNTQTQRGEQARGDFEAPPPAIPPEEDDVLLNDWSAVKLLEEFDPTDLTDVSRPYAFVADHVVRVDLSVSVVEEMARYEERMAREAASERAMNGPTSDDFNNKRMAQKKGSAKKPGWFEKLRDQLQQGEDIRWYLVVCDDEEREVRYDILGRPEPEPPQERPALVLQQEVPKEIKEAKPDTFPPVEKEEELQPATQSETRPGRERSMSASKRAPGGYSPFPRPQSSTPSPQKRPMTGMGQTPLPMRDRGPYAFHPERPQMPPAEEPSPLKGPHKSRSLRKLFGKKDSS